MRRIAWVAFALSLCLAACDDGGSNVSIVGGGDGGTPPPDAGSEPDAAAGDVDAARPGPDAGGAADAAPGDGPDAAVTPDGGGPLPDGGAAAAACANAEDDDGDDLTDYPADPGCTDPADDDEADPDSPACDNGEDDDGDGRVDFPGDPGCSDPADPSEASICGAAQTLVDITGSARVTGDTRGAAAALRAGCRDNEAPEAVFLYRVTDTLASLTFDSRGSSFDTVLSVRRGAPADCADLAAEIACGDDVESIPTGIGQACRDYVTVPGKHSAVRIDDPEPGDYYVILDGFLDGAGPFVLNVREELPDGAACEIADAGGGGEMPDAGLPGSDAGVPTPVPTSPVTCRRGSTCVEGTCVVSTCCDGVDGDGDDRPDFPADPGCESAEDTNEVDDPFLRPECIDFNDNDFNGLVDWPDDPNCYAAGDPEEEPPPDCSDLADNDRDGLIDLADPGCRDDPEWPSEFNLAACRDREDNDEDGLIDYPEDPGCLDPDDPLEDDPDEAPSCANGVDDDGDGDTDFPADADGCTSASDDTEIDPCRDEAFGAREITGLAMTAGNTQEASNEFQSGCIPSTGREQVLLWRVAEDRPLSGMLLTTRQSRFSTLVHVRDACDAEPADELGCNVGGGPGGTSAVRLGPQAPGTDLYIFVDGASPTSRGVWRMQVIAELAEGANCAGGGPWVCGAGLACREEGDGAERCRVADCANGEDDDGDGLTDHPLDPGCATTSDDDEVDPDEPPECSDLIDNDADGSIDADDPQCEAAGDDFEGPDCGDRIDNDRDGSTDYDLNGDGSRDGNADSFCACNDDPTEDVDEPQCRDGCDNDNDGRVDLEDPGCEGDPDRDIEFDFRPPECNDGNDNDGDGHIDFPADPGCANPNSPVEIDPAPTPACGDGIDNDEDGLIDFERGAGDGDPGCDSASDPGEGGRCDGPVFETMPPNGLRMGNTAEESNETSGSCNRSSSAPEVLTVLDVPYPATVFLTTADSGFDTVLYVRRACARRICALGIAEGMGGDPVDAGVVPDAAPAVDAAAPDAATMPDAAGDANDSGVLDAGVTPDAGPDLDAAIDAAVPAVDAAAPAPDAAPDAGPPACVVLESEIACNDDSDGLQSAVEFDWEGGTLYAFVDGFGGSAGNYRLSATVTWPAGGRCDPDGPDWTACEAGTECVFDEAAGFETCQAP